MTVQFSPAELLIELDRKVSRPMECANRTTLSLELLDNLVSIGPLTMFARSKNPGACGTVADFRAFKSVDGPMVVYSIRRSKAA